ncbi:hypothetical protein [Sphingomonas endolithica]|uniref:hypothetical protein n=1 Tax=Sphingomonas endolithica TaxID=2972485 RepID=UPI0021AF3A4F|nr:hypothetical protein [Sphingomonas sp. ZFBP2030]
MFGWGLACIADGGATNKAEIADGEDATDWLNVFWRSFSMVAGDRGGVLVANVEIFVRF